MKTIHMHKYGYEADEVILTKWLKKEGESIREGEAIAEVETIKVAAVLEATTSGILYKILVSEGTTVLAGEPVALVIDQDEQPPDMVNSEIPLERKGEKEMSKEVEEVKMTAETNVFTTRAEEAATERHSLDLKKSPNETIIPLTGSRKTMAEQMGYSARTYASVTSFFDADVTQLLQIRKKLKPLEEEKKVRLTLTVFLVKAVSKVLQEIPILNSTFDGEKIIIKNYYNIGIAMSGENRLIVPVINHVEKKGLLEIARNLAELTEKFQTNTFSVNDVTGSTFTITNIGMTGPSTASAPLINPPESAILSVQSVCKKPVVQNDEIVIRQIMPLSMTFDHRIIFPRDIAEFRKKLKELLEKPQLLLSNEDAIPRFGDDSRNVGNQ